MRKHRVIIIICVRATAAYSRVCDVFVLDYDMFINIGVQECIYTMLTKFLDLSVYVWLCLCCIGSFYTIKTAYIF